MVRAKKKQKKKLTPPTNKEQLCAILCFILLIVMQTIEPPKNSKLLTLILKQPDTQASCFCSLAWVHTQMRKSGKNQGRPGNTYDVNDIRWTWGGLRRGQYLTACTYAINKFYFTSEVECSQSCECLGSCQVTEHSMSTLFECIPLHSPHVLLMSHVISVPRPFFCRS